MKTTVKLFAWAAFVGLSGVPAGKRAARATSRTRLPRLRVNRTLPLRFNRILGLSPGCRCQSWFRRRHRALCIPRASLPTPPEACRSRRTQMVSFDSFRPECVGHSTGVRLYGQRSHGATDRYLVDLNDSSTYNLIDTTAHFNGERPPLAGDLLAPLQEDLLRAGYPPRPDPAVDPNGFNGWVTGVSRSVRRLDAVGVTLLGESADPYDGTYWYENTTVARRGLPWVERTAYEYPRLGRHFYPGN